MYRNLAQLFAAVGGGRTANDVFLVHPLQLSRWLDEAWAFTGRTVPAFGPGTPAQPFLGSTFILDVLDLPTLAGGAVSPVASGVDTADPDVFTGKEFAFPTTSPLIWDHLIYAYLIESTGVFEIMAEVLRRLAVGETLRVLTKEGARWVRATEELFFRDPPLFTIGGIVSQMRSDQRVSRRNAYTRMFDFDPPHAIPQRWTSRTSAGEQPWKVDVGNGVNSGFREKWSELLRQVWLGLENRRNGIGPNATDSEYVALLCRAIKDMLNTRRLGGQLAREEFVHVATMSWFHLTLEGVVDTPIVADLKCEATHPADRLAKIAERVGMTPAPRARELFDLADRMSALLRAIELGLFDTGIRAEVLFLPLPPPPQVPTNLAVLEDMNQIIDLWQSATGDRVKERPAAFIGAQPGGAQPLRVPNPTSPVPVSNGKRG